VVASDVVAPRLAWLREKYGIATAQDNRQAAQGADMVVLAIKPQNLPEVMADLRGWLGPQQMVLSIVAGASLGTLAQGLRHPLVVRAMPNTPAQIGAGMSVWTATKEVAPEQREAAQALLAALGKEIWVEDEKYIDMATAVSASGPAYVFLFMEALIDGAVHIGMPRDMAKLLVLQTVLGSARFAQETGRHPAELRNSVTSPGGTTAEALLQLEEGALRALVTHAIIAAYEKAHALEEASQG